MSNSYRAIIVEIKCIKAHICVHITAACAFIHPPVTALDIVRDFRLVTVAQIHIPALADFTCEIAD